MTPPDLADRTGRERFRLIGVASLASTVVVSPPFLVGVLAVQIANDLGLTPGTIGLVTAAFFGVTALSAVGLGRFVEDRGPHSSLNLVLLVNIVALAVIVSTTSVGSLMVGMAVGGVANGAIHPTANALISQGVSGRIGLALGLKMAAMPMSTFVAGLAVPVVALTLGWRLVPAFVAIIAAALLLSIRRSALPSGGFDARTARDIRRRPLEGAPFLMVVLGAALGATATSTLGAFVVDSGVRMSGVGEASAGLVVALSGAIGIGSRVGFGWLVDGRGGGLPYMLTVAMLATGGCGIMLIASGTEATFLMGSILAFGAGWGWQGLLNYAVLTGATAGAARATGRLLTGFASGSAFGPLVLGQLAEYFGYALMWRTASVLTMLSAAVVAVAGWNTFRSQA